MTHNLEKVAATLYKMPYQTWADLPESVMYKFDAYEPRIIYQNALVASRTLTLEKVRLASVNGRLIKLDGGAARRLTEPAAIPDYVLAEIFDMAEPDYQTLCQKIVRSASTERATGDVTRLAYERLGISFKSQRLASGRLKDAFELALRGVSRTQQDKKRLLPLNIVNTVACFKPELMALDSLDLNADIFVSPVIGGALIMLSISPETIEFFKAYNEERGVTNESGAADPVESLLSFVRDYKKLHIAAQKNIYTHLCKCTVNAVVNWQAGPSSQKYWRKKEIGKIDIRPYVRQVVGLKSSHGPFDKEFTDDEFWRE